MKPNPATGALKLPVTLRPDWFVRVVFAGLAAIAWLPAYADGKIGKFQWDHLALGLGATTALLWLFYTWSIVIGVEGVTYKRWFFLSSHAPYKSMQDVQIRLNMPYQYGGGFKRRFEPVYGLWIAFEAASGLKPLLINIKPFSRPGLATLMHVISSKAPQAQLDRGCERMKQRRMPSLFGAN